MVKSMLPRMNALEGLQVIGANSTSCFIFLGATEFSSKHLVHRPPKTNPRLNRKKRE
jgi:hypothetical protein